MREDEIYIPYEDRSKNIKGMDAIREELNRIKEDPELPEPHFSYHKPDSDLNASRNIAANLRPIGTKERLLCKNRIGFYWSELGQDLIVPVTT